MILPPENMINTPYYGVEVNVGVGVYGVQSYVFFISQFSPSIILIKTAGAFVNPLGIVNVIAGGTDVVIPDMNSQLLSKTSQAYI
jgi:hypothetical protein